MVTLPNSTMIIVLQRNLIITLTSTYIGKREKETKNSSHILSKSFKNQEVSLRNPDITAPAKIATMYEIILYLFMTSPVTRRVAHLEISTADSSYYNQHSYN